MIWPKLPLDPNGLKAGQLEEQFSTIKKENIKVKFQHMQDHVSSYVFQTRVPMSDIGMCPSVRLGYFLAQNKVSKCPTHVRVSRIRYGYLRWNEESEQHRFFQLKLSFNLLRWSYSRRKIIYKILSVNIPLVGRKIMILLQNYYKMYERNFRLVILI